MKGAGGYHEEPLPTAAFCLVLDVPDELFRHAERELAEIALSAEDGKVAVEAVSGSHVEEGER